MQYSVLGLGDQNYSAFMAIPRSFTMAMEKAGATAFYPRGEADDTLGLYEYCETWQDGLWDPLKRAADFAPQLKANPELGAKKAKKEKVPYNILMGRLKKQGCEPSTVPYLQRVCCPRIARRHGD